MRSQPRLNRQDSVNLLAIAISAAAAWFAPLETFLLAYAVLGPFHYLTEIAWLNKKQFFFADGIVSPRIYLWLCVALGALASLDLAFKSGWGGYAIGALLVVSLGAMVRDVRVLLGAMAVVFALKFFVHGYGLFIAVFVPTVVHVFFFTLIFVVSGALRSRNTLFRCLNPLLLVLVPLLLILTSRGGAQAPGAYWIAREQTFAPIHEYISGLLGLGMHFHPGAAFDAGALATFRFLAFIYLHHYLNWFAKTEMLEWHRMSRRSWLWVAAIYAAMLGSYAYSFAVGFYASYFLSMLHVMLELPLDWRGAIGLASEPWVRRIHPARAAPSQPAPAVISPQGAP